MSEHSNCRFNRRWPIACWPIRSSRRFRSWSSSRAMLSYELQTSVAAAGTYGVVLVPQALVSAPTAPGPIFDPVEIAVRFRENVPVSSGPHALEVAETALALLHLYRPTTINEVITAAPKALGR